MCHRRVELRERERETRAGGRAAGSPGQRCLLRCSLSPPATLEQTGSAGCVVVFVCQEDPQPGPRPHDVLLHACLQRVGELELWLQSARRSLEPSAGAAGSADAQHGVERQLLTCQVGSTPYTGHR